MIKEIKANEFKEAVKEGFSIVDIYRENCGPCKALFKTLEEIEFDFPFINIYKINSMDSDNIEFCNELNILGAPTILFIYNGEIVKRELGALSTDAIIEIAKDYLY